MINLKTSEKTTSMVITLLYHIQPNSFGVNLTLATHAELGGQYGQVRLFCMCTAACNRAKSNDKHFCVLCQVKVHVTAQHFRLIAAIYTYQVTGTFALFLNLFRFHVILC